MAWSSVAGEEKPRLALAKLETMEGSAPAARKHEASNSGNSIYEIPLPKLVLVSNNLTCIHEQAIFHLCRQPLKESHANVTSPSLLCLSVIRIKNIISKSIVTALRTEGVLSWLLLLCHPVCCAHLACLHTL